MPFVPLKSHSSGLRGGFVHLSPARGICPPCRAAGHGEQRAQVRICHLNQCFSNAALLDVGKLPHFEALFHQLSQPIWLLFEVALIISILCPRDKNPAPFPPCSFSILARNVTSLVMNSLLGNQYEPRHVTAPRLMEVTWHRKLPVICTASPHCLSLQVSLTMGTATLSTGAHQQESPQRV